MNLRFRTTLLATLETQDLPNSGFGDAAVIAYRKRIQLLRAAVDERALYAMKSLHYEKLKGKRQHQHSIRLNRQFRLILEIDPGPPRAAVIMGIEDYH